MKISTLFTALCFSCISIAHSDPPQNTNRSIQSGNQPVVVSLSNTTHSKVSVLWIDFNGQAKTFGSLAAGQTMKTQTYPGHLWMLSDGKNIVGTYRATSAHDQKFATAHGNNPQQNPQIIQQTPRQMPDNTQQRPQPGHTTPNQTVGGLLHRLIDKKTGRTTQPHQPHGNTNQPNRPHGNVPQSPNVSSVITNTGSSLSVTEAKQMVDFHNQVRREVGVGNVAWSPQIAQFAQQWADHLARTGQFVHRPQNQQRYGESLAGGMGSANPVLTGLQNWYGEKNLYRPAGAPFSVKLMPAGHYTQMVWRGSTQIGAGKAVCKTGQYRGWTIIVCNYNPRGNMIGQPAY